MGAVILTGFMGTGKTTVGKILAERYGLEFIDCDAEVERRCGQSIASLWESRGEEAFRGVESTVFKELLSDARPAVIATGGGTLLSAENRAALRSDDRVFCLRCEIDELVARLGSERDERPLLRSENGSDLATLVTRRLELREPDYAAFEQFDTSGCSPESVADEIGRRAALSDVATLSWDTHYASAIVFGSSLASLGELLRSRGLNGTVLVVSDEKIAAHAWVDVAEDSLREAGYATRRVLIGAGEEHKTLETLVSLYRAAMDARLDRAGVVVGVGGGVIGDIAGTLAATYLRGLRLVLAPTTLLAQVDAAIGGKVGIDLDGVKNLVGAFYPADLVAIDPDTLSTLPLSALSDGLAEVVKIATVRSAALLASVESLHAPADILHHRSIIRRAALEKVKLVQQDPYERGDRGLLNFGHTIGHGLESASGYCLSHGQAISIGMVAETWLAEQRGWCEPGVLERLKETLTKLGLPVSAPDFDPARVLDIIGQDKKRRGSQIRFAVPIASGLGTMVDVTGEDVAAAVTYALRGRV